MKTLFFPLLFSIVFLLQILQSSTDDIQTTKNKIFNTVKGLENIFKFFGEEMDEKAKMVISSWETVLKYDVKTATFLQVIQSGKKKRSHVDWKKLEAGMRFEIGEEEPVLIGLNNLLINTCEKDGRIYLSRTGVVKSENGYFILRRCFAVNEWQTQYFRRFKICKKDPYAFWIKSCNKQNKCINFWINGDFRKYYKFNFTPETEANHFFNRIDFIHRNQYESWNCKKRLDVVLSAQEMFEEYPQNRKHSQETASSTPPRTMSFSGYNESNFLFPNYSPDEMGKQGDDKYLKGVLPAIFFIFLKKAKLYKKFQEALEEDFQLYINPVTKAYYDAQYQTFLLLQNNLNALIFDHEKEDEYLNAKKDEHSVLKKSLSFVFFDDEHLSQAEKDLEFQNLLRNENFNDENLDY